MVSHSNLRSNSEKSIAVRLLAVNVILNFSIKKSNYECSNLLKVYSKYT